MSSIARWLAELQARGFDFTTQGSDLVLEADREPTAQEDRWVAENKMALVRELTAVRLDFETTSPLNPWKLWQSSAETTVTSTAPASAFLIRDR